MILVLGANLVVCGLPWRRSVHGTGFATVTAASTEMRFPPLPPASHSPTQTRAGDGLLYLPGSSLATPQYSRRIKRQAIYNASVKAGCIAGSHPHLPGLCPHQTPPVPLSWTQTSAPGFVGCFFFFFGRLPTTFRAAQRHSLSSLSRPRAASTSPPPEDDEVV